MTTLFEQERSRQLWNAVAEVYHAYFTGMVLYVSSRHGNTAAEELVYEIFSKQREEKFLPGLKKLNLDQLPHAVAAAQYHYLSNHIGGVSVEYMPESDNKARIRYSPPRWIWSGTALCGIAPEISTAMLRGWHAQNGLMLNNPRLGFVCTKQTVDGQSGLEGYYYEYKHDLQPHERLRFAREEEAPLFDQTKAPTLPTTEWPKERLAKAHRNYAMEYMRTSYQVAFSLGGPIEATHRLNTIGKMIGMQFYHEIKDILGAQYSNDAKGFTQFMIDFISGHGDKCTKTVRSENICELEQEGFSFAKGLGPWPKSFISAWAGLLQGAAVAHNRQLDVSCQFNDTKDSNILWTIKTKPIYN